MDKKKHFYFLLLLAIVAIIPLIPLTSSISVTPNNFNVTVQEGFNQPIQFNITNNHGFSMFNITPESNTILQFSKINELTAGQSLKINATVLGVSNFNGEIRIKGFFQNTIGKQFETHEVTFDLDNELSLCDQTIIEGDTISWSNKDSETIRLINANTGGEIATLNPNQTFSREFANPETLSYYVSIIGVQFSDTCTITAISSQGSVNNPLHDAILNLQVKVIFPNTTLQVSTPTTQYNLNFSQEANDIFNIKNTGAEIARNVTLKGDWFTSFTSNNFDLAPGQTRNIGYTLKPKGITQTSDTNKTYNKQLLITGNFPTFNTTFEVFIPLADLDSITQNTNADLDTKVQVFLEVIQAYCLDPVNQQKQVCKDLRGSSLQGFLQSGDKTDQEKIIEELTKAFTLFRSQQGKDTNALKTILDNVSQIVNQNTITSGDLDQKLNNVENKIGGIDGSLSTVLIFVAIIVIFGSLIYLVFYYKKKRIYKDHINLR